MCKFCERFERATWEAVKSDLPYTYSVAFIDHVIINRKLRSRTVHYMRDGIGFPLRYCPECGKKLVED